MGEVKCLQDLVARREGVRLRARTIPLKINIKLDVRVKSEVKTCGQVLSGLG